MKFTTSVIKSLAADFIVVIVCQKVNRFTYTFQKNSINEFFHNSTKYQKSILKKNPLNKNLRKKWNYKHLSDVN